MADKYADFTASYVFEPIAAKHSCSKQQLVTSDILINYSWLQKITTLLASHFKIQKLL